MAAVEASRVAQAVSELRAMRDHLEGQQLPLEVIDWLTRVIELLEVTEPAGAAS